MCRRFQDIYGCRLRDILMMWPFFEIGHSTEALQKPKEVSCEKSLVSPVTYGRK